MPLSTPHVPLVPGWGHREERERCRSGGVEWSAVLLPVLLSPAPLLAPYLSNPSPHLHLSHPFTSSGPAHPWLPTSSPNSLKSHLLPVRARTPGHMNHIWSWRSAWSHSLECKGQKVPISAALRQDDNKRSSTLSALATLSSVHTVPWASLGLLYNSKP